MANQQPTRRAEDRLKPEPPKWLFKARLGVLCVSVLLLIVGMIAPDRILNLHPAATTNLFLYGDMRKGDQSSVSWLDKTKHQFRCHIGTGTAFKYCGIALKFSNPGSQQSDGSYRALNLSQFETLHLDINYRGDAKKLRVYVRDALEPLGPERFLNDSAQKYLLAEIAKEEYGDTIHLDFDEFRVADWWMSQHQQPRKHGKPTFHRVLEIGFDLPPETPAGRHDITVQNLSASGQWSAREDLYLWIIIIWLTWMTIETGVHLFRARGSNRSLADSLSRLQKETQLLDQDAYTDPVTGSQNRASLDRIKSFLFGSKFKNHLVLYVIDIDHFKRLSDTLGKTAGDHILRQFAETLSEGKRTVDQLICWEHHVFIYVAPFASESPRTVAERLRNNTRETVFNILDSQQSLKLTISIGYTQVRPHDTFEKVLARAEEALHTAVSNGGNSSLEG